MIDGGACTFRHTTSIILTPLAFNLRGSMILSCGHQLPRGLKSLKLWGIAIGLGHRVRFQSF